MIKTLTDQKIEGIEYTTWEEFEEWLKGQLMYQFDIETNVTEWWCTKKVMTLQFGSVDTDLQFVLEYSKLNEKQLSIIEASLSSWQILKLIHRASFEYIVMRFHGIEIHNVYCTLVAEKVLQGGIEIEDYDLATLTERYCGITLDKTLQTSFGDGILTAEKIKYAADDVKYLDTIKMVQDAKIQVEELGNVIWLEMRSLLAFSDCTYHGVGLDQPLWRANIALAQPLVDESKKRLDHHVMRNSLLLAKAISMGLYATEDKVLINFNSHQQKAKLLQVLYPDLTGASQGTIKGYLKERPWLGMDDHIILGSLIEGIYQPLLDLLLKDHYQFLVDNNYLAPKGTISINWNSRDQVLPLAKVLHPRLKDLSEESLANLTEDLFTDLSDYKDNLKLVSSYGEAFIRKHVEPDGKVRTNYNQVVSTGRSSSARPNMQNIPAKDAVGTRYRNAFIYDLNWLFVDSDFTGQELALIAEAAQDDVWFTAITKQQDLHSVTAELVFKAKWKNATSPGCTYYNPSYVLGDDVLTEEGYNLIGRPEGWRYAEGKQKCKCKGHKSLRGGVKTINFGLAYGMSKFKLSSTMRIVVNEAQALIDEYFKTFPKIKVKLDAFGRFGVENGYIKTFAPFGRKRWFPYWEYCKGAIRAHITGIEYNKDLGSIERASKNMPFQGSGGDMIKLAMWMVYKYIRDNDLRDKVHILLNVHDQLTTACIAEIADWWKVEFDKLMVAAGKVIIPSGILRADTNISTVWTK